MYKGTNKTAVTSQRRIAEAFVKLFREQDYTSINISAICRTAGVSRQTFYSLFKSKENVINYLLDQTRYFVPGKYFRKNRITIDEICREYSRFVAEKREFLALLVKNGLPHLLQRSIKDFLMDFPAFLPERTGINRKLAAEFVAGGFTGVAKVFALNSDLNEEEIAISIAKLFKGDYL